MTPSRKTPRHLVDTITWADIDCVRRPAPTYEATSCPGCHKTLIRRLPERI